ncbi:MAG TPA: carboxypeptidase-like regulatory domain-containing protein [Planctomycetota bacterium]
MRPLAMLLGLLAVLFLVWLGLHGLGRASRQLAPRPGEPGPASAPAAAVLRSGNPTRDLDPQAEPGREAPAAAPTVATTPTPEPAAPRLRVTMLDAGDGTPLPGYRLEFFPVFQNVHGRSATTGEDGTLELELEPGEHLVLHRAAAGVGQASLSRALTPQRFEVLAAEPGTVQEQTLHARLPPGVLLVEVTHPDGRPAADAIVTFASIQEDEPLVDLGSRTDAGGRANLGVWDTEAFEDGVLGARDEEGHVSELLRIETPFVPGLRRLVLGPAASLDVRVLESDGRPAAKHTVVLASDLLLPGHQYRETGAEGRWAFDGLFAGRYLLSVAVPETRGWQRQSVELLRGERRALEVVLERPEHPLAVAGQVLDEEGRPLAGEQLAVAIDGHRVGLVKSDEQGAFRVFRPAGRRVWVGPNAVQQGDRFEPAEIEEDFGADFLVFRRVQRAEPRVFEVEVYDTVTGQELEHFVAQIDRGPGTEDWSDSYAPRRRFELALLPGARWRVKASGHVTRELQLLDELDALEPGQRLRVGLDPGLDHTFRLLDADSLEPVHDVLLHSESAGDARSDAAGRVHLRADHWSVYRMTKEGYASEDWDPEQYLLWGRDRYLMTRE